MKDVRQPGGGLLEKTVRVPWTLLLIVIGVGAVLAFFGVSIGINPTASQPYRLFAIVKGHPSGRGDLIAFRFPGSRYYPEGTLFVKEVIGIPGDHLEIRSDRTVRVDGAFLDTVRATDSKGKAVEPFLFDGIIPEGAFFLYSPVPNSYDSRYYGLIGKDQIVGRAIPLL